MPRLLLLFATFLFVIGCNSDEQVVNIAENSSGKFIILNKSALLEQLNEKVAKQTTPIDDLDTDKFTDAKIGKDVNEHVLLASNSSKTKTALIVLERKGEFLVEKKYEEGYRWVICISEQTKGCEPHFVTKNQGFYCENIEGECNKLSGLSDTPIFYE